MRCTDVGSVMAVQSMIHSMFSSTQTFITLSAVHLGGVPLVIYLCAIRLHLSKLVSFGLSFVVLGIILFFTTLVMIDHTSLGCGLGGLAFAVFLLMDVGLGAAGVMVLTVKASMFLIKNFRHQ